jgi:hypothetical protein
MDTNRISGAERVSANHYPSPKVERPTASISDLSTRALNGSSHVADRLQAIIDTLDGSATGKDGGVTTPTFPIQTNLNITIDNIQRIDNLLDILSGKLFSC